jgi:predicted amidohydrolase YtcJ
MKTIMQNRSVILITAIALSLASVPAYSSHRAILFNEKAMDRVLEMWPDFVESINNQPRGVETPGERGVIMQSPMRSHLANLLREQVTPEQYGEGYIILVKDSMSPRGLTAHGGRVNTSNQVTAYNYLSRKGEMPIRYAYSLDLARQAIPRAAAAGFYEYQGASWGTIETNPWLWMHGMSAEGDWDSVSRGCTQGDLPVKPGVDEREVKEIIEICPDFDSSTVQSLMRGIRSGWRFAGVHGIGSHGFRLFIQKLEGHMAANPKQLTLEYVRESRHGFAHGTLTGAVPDVVEGMVKYNLYIPIDLERALNEEPPNCQKNYVEACWDFIGPVKTLLDAGVKVVGEGVSFDSLDLYVNRTILEGDDAGTVYNANEGVDRVVALKLFTYRSAEFIYGESKIGSLEVGKYADFVVSDKPYLSGPDSEIHNNKIVMTVSDGEIKYQDPEYQPVER